VTPPAAVVFDLDGVLIDSESVWNDARRELVERSGGRWRADAQRAMMGMSSVEWSSYLHDELGVPLSSEEISAAVVAELERRYRERLPLVDGAREAVVRVAARWPLALASSANRPVIELALHEAGLADRFAATVSSEEVPRGKPAPDVYLEAARRLDVDPAACVAVEDSSNGLRSAAAARMGVIAVPNREFPPDDDALALATLTLDAVGDLEPEDVEEALSRRA
jgi:HAD superfamily hydrolase (TIGR01509 family)